MNPTQQERATDAPEAAVASMNVVAETALAGVEKLADLNLQSMRTGLAEQHEIAEAIVAAPPETIPLWHSAQAQAALRKNVSYWSHVNRIAVETFTELVASCWVSLADSAKQIESAFADVLRDAAVANARLPAAVARTSPLDAKGVADMSPGTRDVELVDEYGHVVSSTKPEGDVRSAPRD